MHKPVWRDDAELARALLAWRDAPRLCAGACGVHGDCTDYHRVWPLLRFAGLRSEPLSKGVFYEEALGAALGKGARRLLISGAADEAMAALLVRMAERHGITADITLLDRCPTPLAITNQFALDRGRSVQTIHADVVTWTPPEQFDLVVTDSFLHQFSPPVRSEVFLQWWRCLRPGGVLITVSPLVERGGSGREKAVRAEELASAAWSRLQPYLPTSCISEAEFHRAVQGYSVNKKRHPIQSSAMLAAELVSSPLRIRCLKTLHIDPGTGIKAWHGTAQGSYACLVAVASKREPDELRKTSGRHHDACANSPSSERRPLAFR